MLDAITAMMQRYTPAPILNVVEEIPEFAQGETADKPIPAPNARSASVKAAEATPPATIAAHETAGT
jgi:hypothetical protein